MTDEEGLQGSWFLGTIAQLQHGFALVAYDELMVSEDSDEKLQEWFPLPGATQAKQALLDATYDSHFGPGFKIRPPPPPEVGQTCCIALHRSMPSSITRTGSFKCSVPYVFEHKKHAQGQHSLAPHSTLACAPVSMFNSKCLSSMVVLPFCNSEHACKTCMHLTLHWFVVGIRF